MGWLLETLIDWFWIGLIERTCEGKPWWVRLLWVLSPLWIIAILAALLWLLVG
jgi:hypothetical protein